MTQENKELLLKDLCARLPYGVKCKIALYKTAFNVLGIVEDKVNLDSPVYDEGDDWWEITEIKPYLRPMSSMTEEERKSFPYPYYFEVFDADVSMLFTDDKVVASISVFEIVEIVNWLNKHHFDYRGLIPMGLALEAPEGMYNIKEK